MIREVLLFVALTVSPAAADEARCVISVGGTTYLDEPCEVGMADRSSITLGVGGESRSKYFVYLNEQPDGTRVGYWNGALAESHAHDDLGQMKQDGTCWIGSDAKVCYYSDHPLDIGFGN